MATGKQPDYNVSCMDETSGDRNNRIGAAWVNEDGSIGVKLSPGVVLTPALSIRLWPVVQTQEQVAIQERRRKTKRGNDGSTPPVRPPASLLRQPLSRPPPSGFDDMDDDIPF